jgi:beta-1,4-N-acetylglucosaminyltransferase
MKIAMVSSHGGHLTELRMLADALEEHDLFYVTYDSERTRHLDMDVHTVEHIGTNPVAMATAFGRMGQLFRQERPDLVISTGSEIAIPAFVVGKLLSATTIFVESWCRVTNQSATGRLVYPIADHFFVQWPQLLGEYGKKAEYQGAVV